MCAALPVVDQILRRGMSIDPSCQIRGQEREFINHVLFTCSVARQVWALSGVPTPEFGFQNGSIFANIQFLFELQKNSFIPIQISRSWPWVLWRLWKNRNKFFFDGITFCPLKSIAKNNGLWLKSIIRNDEPDDHASNARCLPPWEPPQVGWVKCNIAAAWSGKKRLCGGAWVLRDNQGKVLLHSRKAFSHLTSKKEYLFRCVLWAITSMLSHRQSRVIFAFEPGDLSFAFTQSKAWPCFAFQVSELTHFMEKIEEWKVIEEKVASNKGASLIAQNVIKEDRLQSYVAAGPPHWLHRLFEGERISL